jgi:DNA-binding CsgD family transcriptional regulator
MPARTLRATIGAMTTDPDTLTHREREVLGLLALGNTNREVAGHLHISIRTAEFHRASIQHKLGLGARSELVRFALEHGVLAT